jgi:peroxiredoxin (alkyl hydroperoxide reductase subunit C)
MIAEPAIAERIQSQVQRGWTLAGGSVTLAVGEEAPDFELPALIGGVKRPFRLSSHRGKQQVLLAFYPANWEPLSERQLVAYQAEQEQLAGLRTVPVAVCVDSIMNTTAWERAIGPLDFAMCADFWPHGEVAEKYGVLRRQEPKRGACERALFVVDVRGQLIFQQVYGVDELIPLAGTLDLLQKLRTGDSR